MKRISQVSHQSPPGDDRRWQAVVARDGSFDGQFLYSVATTGVYCRPSCGARLPNRKNVRFYDTAADAEKAGFRPCKRCKPNEASIELQHAKKVAEACRLIENAEATPTLHEVASAVGLSPYHFHRLFKAALGVTPKAYATAQRNKRTREKLKRSESVTEAIYEGGFNSSGRFYEGSAQLLGMTPGAFRSGGTHQRIRFAVGECSLGSIVVAASDRGVCAILLGDNPETLVRDLQNQFPRADLLGGDENFEQLAAKVIGFVEAPRSGLDLPLDVQGTAFQLPRVGRTAPHSRGLHGKLCRDRGSSGSTEIRSRCGTGLRCKPSRSRDSLPPRGPQRRRAFGLSLGCRAQAGASR
jgi:AraC family transcriptional regulator, regulatory protein of adaptative response / methylated-DNA-[protein]-cysteine methyltransferase